MDEDEIFWSPIHPMVKFPFELASNDGDRFRSPSIQWQKISPIQWWKNSPIPMVKIAFTHHQINVGDWFSSPRKRMTIIDFNHHPTY
jgi:hypothetical protein